MGGRSFNSTVILVFAGALKHSVTPVRMVSKQTQAHDDGHFSVSQGMRQKG